MSDAVDGCSAARCRSTRQNDTFRFYRCIRPTAHPRLCARGTCHVLLITITITIKQYPDSPTHVSGP
eukprot:6786777-Prymnesium_polylepis.1